MRAHLVVLAAAVVVLAGCTNSSNGSGSLNGTGDSTSPGGAIAGPAIPGAYFDYSDKTVSGYDVAHKCDIAAVGAIVFASIGLSVPSYAPTAQGASTCLYFPRDVVGTEAFAENITVTLAPYTDGTLAEHVSAFESAIDVPWKTKSVAGVGTSATYVESRIGDNPTYSSTSLADLTTANLSAQYPSGVWDVGFALLSPKYHHLSIDELKKLVKAVAK